MAVDDEMKEMINQSATAVAMRKKAQEKGMKLLWEDGREKVLKGITTFEEVARVCEEQGEVKKEEKAAEVEVKPFLHVLEESKEKLSQAKNVKVDAKALEEYKSRMTKWLSNK